MKLLRIILILLVPTSLVAQRQSFETGRIIDSIRVANTPDESYQLYLPGSYDPNTESAIIFIFEPVARGTVGIQPFIKGAETYNYILVCSNNSKNGPYDANFEISNRLFADVFSRFKIDSKQVYTAGFSGGSRLATTIAALTNAIQGVIGCGAGFMTNVSGIELPNSFTYVGLVGDEDMNYQEMFRFSDWLTGNGIRNELFTYADGHRWPLEDWIVRALGWLQLQAYERGVRPANKEVVSTLYNELYDWATQLEYDQQTVSAMMEYRRLVRNFSNYFETDSIGLRIESLKANPKYSEALSISADIAQIEQQLSDKFVNKFNEEATMARSTDDFEWWRRELKVFNERYTDTSDYYTTKMVKRLRYSFMALAYETAQFYERTDRIDQLLYCHRILVLLHPDNPFWEYRLAVAYAKQGELNETLASLKAAIAKGFTRTERIISESAFEKFKGARRFDKFLGSLDN